VGEQSIMALIPRVVPVQAKIRGLSTCEIVEVIVVCPALQMNFDPGANSPCKEADNTSAFHSGQWSMEDIAMISLKANDIRKLPAKPRRLAKTVKPSFLHHPLNHSFSQKGKV